MTLRSLIGNLKISYMIYNLLHWNRLAPNRRAYRKYGFRRPSWMPVTHDKLKHLEGERPWLDKESLAEISKGHDGFESLPPNIRKAIVNWSEDGYAIIPGLISSAQAETINDEVKRLVDSGAVKWRYGNKKIMFAFRHSQAIREIIAKSNIQKTLEFIMGKEIQLFQSINFHKGSEQKAHSDSIHMTTHPEGHLIAVWIALEDISIEAGALSYYPGSHKLPYIYNEHYPHGGNYFMLGPAPYDAYEEKVEQLIDKHKLKSKYFEAKKGDALIWHSNLLHGGSPVTDPEATRKSMVLHYYASEAICYHEISQRPTLWN